MTAREQRVAVRARKIEEMLVGRIGGSIERAGAAMKHWDETKHLRSHGRFAFMEKREHPLSASDRHANPFGNYQTHEDLLRHTFSSSDRSVLGTEHETITRSLHAVGAHDLAKEMDAMRSHSQFSSGDYTYPKAFAAKVRSRVGGGGF